jgi:hypothetical protein
LNNTGFINILSFFLQPNVCYFSAGFGYFIRSIHKRGHLLGRRSGADVFPADN